VTTSASILVADDNDVSARFLNRLLTRETVNLIVLDLMLPGEDGLTLVLNSRLPKALGGSLKIAGNETGSPAGWASISGAMSVGMTGPSCW
jgi:CheY-like chemotaxis protein